MHPKVDVYKIIMAKDEGGALHQVYVRETRRQVLAGTQTIASYILVRTDEPLHFEHGVMVGDVTGIRLRPVD